MFDYQPHLVGSLVELRPLVAADWDALFAVASDPLIWEIHPQPDRYTEPVFRKFFDEGLQSGGTLIALDRETKAIIGSSRYSQQFVLPHEIEIGWTFLARSRWGGPYNRDMKRLMLEHAFRFFDTVIFRIGEHNYRSRRAVEKIGGVLTDRTQQSALGTAAVTHVFYAITREAYAAAPLT